MAAAEGSRTPAIAAASPAAGSTVAVAASAAPPGAAAAAPQVDGQVATPTVAAPVAAPSIDPLGERLSCVLALQARALSDARFEPAATSIASELCARLRCERVSIGLLERDRMRVRALSNTGEIRREQDTLRLIAAAMEEAVDQSTSIVYPLPADAAPQAILAHAQLAAANDGASVCTVPLANGTRVLGALTLERRAGFDAAAVRLAADVAVLVGPALELKARVDAPLGGRIVEAFNRRGRRLLGVEPTAAKMTAAAALLLLVVAALWPTTYRVLAPARVEGAIQRVVTAPAEGYVREVHVRPGETVVADQLLATLEDRDLLLEHDKLQSEAAQLDKQYGEALAKGEAGPIVVAQAKLEHVDAQLALVEHRLRRVQLRAPFDGVVLSGDLAHSIGAPVKRGEELMIVAPLNRYRIVVEVDETDIAELRPGLGGQALFAAARDQVPLRVTRVAPLAVARAGRNFFEVEAGLPEAAAAAEALRPGMAGVAKIDIDQRALLSAWYERARHWLRRIVWRFTG